MVGEIVAQHLENRLKRPVERRLGMGATVIVYQALANGELTVYPEYSGVIESEILKEQPPADAQMVFERARGGNGAAIAIGIAPDRWDMRILL